MIEDEEGFWADVHYGVGVAFGLIGIEREHAETLMETWEITEPGLWTGWGWWAEYLGRDNLEGGVEGWEFDVTYGLEGYDAAESWREYLREKFEGIFTPSPEENIPAPRCTTSAPVDPEET